MKDILKKLEGVMEEADLIALQAAIEDKINEAVQTKVELVVEEKTAELEKLAEEYAELRLEEEKVKLEEAKKADMEALESSLIENLDAFLESEISEKISDEALAKIAINETLLPVVEGIRKVFEESHIAIDSEGATIVKESVEKIKALEEQNSQLIAEKMELNEKVEDFEKASLLDEKVEGLSEDQQRRVFMMFESASVEDIQNKIDDFIDIVISEENIVGAAGGVAGEAAGKHNEIIVEGEDGIEEVKPVMNESKEKSISKAAARYL